MTLDPTANLANNTRYTVTLANTIGDAKGNKLAATTWSFTTAAAPVLDPAPTVTGRTPAANATNVAVGTNVMATFSEAVTGVNGTNVTVDQPERCDVSANGDLQHGHPDRDAEPAPQPGSQHPLHGVAVQRHHRCHGQPAGGNDVVLHHGAAPVVDPAPTVTGRTPAANARNVARGSNITVDVQ